ncbi:MAG: hypothetical protein ACJA08_002953 [Cyclobacteriaceae bacterium]|jgi:hypothetical protein
MRPFHILVLVSIIWLSSCGTTRIVTNNPDAVIYVNNVKKGKGPVEIKRMGPPQKTNIHAEYQGTKTDNQQIKREFDLGTLILGLYSYGVGLVVGWRYPKEILIPLNLSEYYITPDFKEGQATSPWMNPPKAWGSK